MTYHRIQGMGMALAVLACCAAAPVSAADEGARVARDATGALRAPTAAENKALDRKAAAAAVARVPRGLITGKANPQVVRHANGMKSAELTEAQMTYSVMVRGADGKLQRYCVTDAHEAERLASGQQAMARQGEEHDHEH